MSSKAKFILLLTGSLVIVGIFMMTKPKPPLPNAAMQDSSPQNRTLKERPAATNNPRKVEIVTNLPVLNQGDAENQLDRKAYKEQLRKQGEAIEKAIVNRMKYQPRPVQ